MQAVGHGTLLLCNISSSSSMLYGEGEVIGQYPLHIVAHRLHPLPPVSLQRHPNFPSQMLHPCLAPPSFPPHGDSLVNEPPRLLQDPQFVARRPFVRIYCVNLQLGKYLVRLRPSVASWKSERKVHPSPEVAQVLPWGSATQAPHDHEMARVVPWIPEVHVPENLSIVPQNIVRTGTHLPPLPHHRQRPPVPTPYPTLRKEVL